MDPGAQANSPSTQRGGCQYWAAGLALMVCSGAPLADAAGQSLDSRSISFFESKVRPLLIERCYECHAGTKRKGGLRLDTKTGWQQGGDHGPALIPGDPVQSLLIKAVSHQDEELKMPPKSRLSGSEIEILVNWVRLGAPDPRETGERPGPAEQELMIEEGRRHWAFKPLSNPSPPRVSNEGWPRGPIDRFILAQLETAGLRPVQDAERTTWLRRVSFDLTGLPPTPAEVAAFLNEPNPRARGAVVDRLLTSAAFGERWARHWLDLVGYADQLGTVNDVPAPHAWRYRDYVVRAFNADKPFDQFIREQLAGDQLAAPSVEARQDAMTATGFLLLGEIHIVTADKQQLRADIVDHQIQKVGTTFLGQTLGCVRCHDHKFDPIRLDDYYGLAGIFASSESEYITPRGVWSSILSTELPETATERFRREKLLAGHDAHASSLESERADLEAQLAETHRRLQAIPVAKGNTNQNATADSLRSSKSELEKRIAGLSQRLLHLNYIRPAAPQVYALRDAAAPGDAPILIRGQPRAPGRVVPRGFVRVVSPGNWPSIPPRSSGRLQLAEWLVSSRNPLTPRVAVNRIWQKLMGEGLARSVDYFGTRGDPPTHPELLDWLAGELVRNDWSQKRLIREIVLSRVYGLSSVPEEAAARRDPDNRLLWRMNRRRLDAEALRDAVLAVSGELQLSAPGPALALQFPENVGGLDPKDVNPISFKTAKFAEEQQRVRTLYLPVVRSRAQPGPAELRNLFDFIPPTEMAGQRPATSVATQALFLMNSEFMKSYAVRLADWLLRQDANTGPARLDLLYLRALGRPILVEEAAKAAEFLQSDGSGTDGLEARRGAWISYCHALLSSNEFLFCL